MKKKQVFFKWICMIATIPGSIRGPQELGFILNSLRLNPLLGDLVGEPVPSSRGDYSAQTRRGLRRFVSLNETAIPDAKLVLPSAQWFPLFFDAAINHLIQKLITQLEFRFIMFCSTVDKVSIYFVASTNIRHIKLKMFHYL